MLVLKWFMLFALFGGIVYLGRNMSNQYQTRVNNLKEMRGSLNMLQTKIKYTYMPLPDIFEEISSSCSLAVANIFDKAREKMQKMTAGQAWEEAVEEAKNTGFKQEDNHTIKALGKLLGKTDVEGQISEIELVQAFLETQIQKAEEECQKNQKLYKTLGVVGGLGIVIILA